MNHPIMIHAQKGQVLVNLRQPSSQIQLSIHDAVMFAEGLLRASRQDMQQSKPLVEIPNIALMPADKKDN